MTGLYDGALCKFWLASLCAAFRWAASLWVASRCASGCPLLCPAYLFAASARRLGALGGLGSAWPPTLPGQHPRCLSGSVWPPVALHPVGIFLPPLTNVEVWAVGTCLGRSLPCVLWRPLQLRLMSPPYLFWVAFCPATSFAAAHASPLHPIMGAA